MTSSRLKLAVYGVGIALVTSVPAWSISEPARPGMNDWTWPPLIVIPLALTAVMYALGTVRMQRRARTSNRRRPILYFALGWLFLVIALDSPLHEIGEQLFWVHMTQHEILMLISAPLLVLGQPLLPFLWALSPALRQRVVTLSRYRVFQKTWASVSTPLSAWLFSAAALWIWHAPWLFNRTLSNDWVHAAQHTSFLIAGLLFWWPLANFKPTMSSGAGVAYVFTTVLHTSILGALLLFAQRPWYSPYLATAPMWHLTALEDQQLGGLIMWIPAGTILIVIALILLVKWMHESEKRWQYTRMAEFARLSKGGTQ
jgi:putative membrane protein